VLCRIKGRKRLLPENPLQNAGDGEPPMVKVIVCGASGRMGQTIGRMVKESPGLELVGGVDLKPGSFFGVDIVESQKLEHILKSRKPEVLIDFTIAHAAVENVKTAAKNNVAVVIGTTGFTPEQKADMVKAIEGHIPAVISSNFSVGVNIFWQLVRDAAKLLKEYDIEVIESHHRNKKDAPSGTAKTILQILDEEVGTRKKLYGREGMMERGNEIGVHVIRGGDIVGDHKVMFSKNFETIELSHRAYDRSVFASGALRATRWVVGKKPGLYGMTDVLGLTVK
jgi:4-hydroxy-tetrahydrodipicolinate reductase